MPNSSTFNWRKESPLHFYHRAENARMCAQLLFDNRRAKVEFKAMFGYSGSVSIAYHEGYLREIALSMELITKAVINANIEKQKRQKEHINAMPKHHKIPDLWKTAKLPTLEEIDMLRLRMLQELLEWSGRYPTPKNEKQFLRHIEESSPSKINSANEIIFCRPISLEWEDYDRIYCIAREEFSKLSSNTTAQKTPDSK